MKNGRKLGRQYRDAKTSLNLKRVENARRLIEGFEKDLDKEERLKAQLCRVCYYQPPRGSLQAFTNSDCGHCGTTMTFATSHTDELCMRCACMTESCKECAGEMN
jgi:hypothetical protein